MEVDDIARGMLGNAPISGRAEYVAAVRDAWARGGIDELRIEKRRRLLHIAACDLAGELSLEEVGARLAHLADACFEITLQELAVDDVGVVAMGKLGGNELNYFSDVDVMFVTAGDVRTATTSAERVLRELGGFSSHGRAYVIDANLRPEGRNGALVRTLESFREYYERWAQPWEFQALIKARPAGGDLATSRALIDSTRELVFPETVPAERVAAIRRVKERVEEHATRARSRRRGAVLRNVKLGPGGIRDIEFAVQLLQLVHGGSDASVRAASTLAALGALVAGGYVAEEDGAGLDAAYRWLRTVEHRLQLWQERRVHDVPADEPARTRLARVLGFQDSPRSSAVERFEDAHASISADVRGRFDKLFYRPMIESLSGATRDLDADAIKQRLRILGYRDVDRAARTLEGLVFGTSRRAKLLSVLTPAMLRYLAGAPLPDEGLIGFLRLGESLGTRLDALGALRDNPPALALLARALGSGRLLGELLSQVPEELATVTAPSGSDLLKDGDRLRHDASASLEWRAPGERLDGLRRFKRREMLHIALADLRGDADVDGAGRALSDLADACVAAALENDTLPFVVIGMGKLGGRELNYASDIDIMFVHDGSQGAAESAAEDLVAAIGEVTPEGQAFRVDLGLRPEGKAGALVRSVDACIEYYTRWSKPWEHLALIKARCVAGDARLGLRFLDATRALAHPAQVAPRVLEDIRHLKARMERERIPKGTDPRRHLKLGPGGMTDVEFAAQLVQLRHAHAYERLRVTGTLEAIDAAAQSGVIEADAARRLTDAYRFLSRARNALFLMAGRPIDVLPDKPETLEALGIAMNYRDQPRQELEDDYLRVTRRARRAAEALIYG